MNVLTVYDRYMKTKIRIFGNNVYTNFRGLNVSAVGVTNDCKRMIVKEFFTILYIDSLLVYENKYYLQGIF